jgi:hypothetical protein
MNGMVHTTFTLRLLCILWASLCLSPSLLAQTSTQPIVMPFQAEQHEIVLEGRINGKPCRLTLDTGATRTTLLAEAAQRLGIQAKQELLPGVSESVIPSIDLKGIRLTHVPCLVREWRELEARNWLVQNPSDGVIGLDVFQKFAVGVDFPNRLLLLWEGGRLSAPQISLLQQDFNSAKEIQTLSQSPAASPPRVAAASDWKRPFHLPLRQRADELYEVEVVLDSIRTHMVFDTGAENMILSYPLARLLKPLSESAVQPGPNKDARQDPTYALLRCAQIGELNIDYPIVKRTDHYAAVDVFAVLGCSVFSECRIVLDFPAKALYISLPASLPVSRSVLLNQMGLFTKATKHGVVGIPLIHSPVYQAGFKNNAMLQQINGKPIKPSIPLEKQGNVDFASQEQMNLMFSEGPGEPSKQITLPLHKRLTSSPTQASTLVSQRGLTRVVVAFPNGGVWLPPNTPQVQVEKYAKRSLPAIEFQQSRLYRFRGSENKPQKEILEETISTHLTPPKKPLAIAPDSTVLIAKEGTVLIIEPSYSPSKK